jgi:hypothetical protein
MAQAEATFRPSPTQIRILFSWFWFVERIHTQHKLRYAAFIG